MDVKDIPVPVNIPFRLDLCAWVLKRVPHNFIDLWDKKTYSRIIVIDDKVVRVQVIQKNNDEIKIRMSSRNSLEGFQKKVVVKVKEMLGLDIDLSHFYRIAENDRDLKRMVPMFVGLKPPRFPSIFEAMVNAISCQQLSLDYGILILNRLSPDFRTFLVKKGTFTHKIPILAVLKGTTSS
jgi:DNA-3-methyladenine glycosylase II